MNLIFYDNGSGTPLYHADLPAGFAGEAVYTPIRYPMAETFTIRGTAAAPSAGYRLYFRTGEGFTYSDMQTAQPLPAGSRNEQGVITHNPCTAAEQADEFAADFAGRPLRALQYMDLAPEICARLQPETEEELTKQYNIAVQALSISPMPMNMQMQGWVNDGGTGVYSFETESGVKYLLTTLWRRGMQYLIMPQGLNLSGYYAQMARPVTVVSWVVPTVIYLLSDREPDAEMMAVHNRFAETLTPSQELKAYTEALEQQNLQRSFAAAQQDSMRRQAEINEAFRQQQAGWARSDALRQSLSQDLDSFRAGLNARMNAYDALHAPGGALYSGPAGGAYGETGESFDDRIQRRRHEAMMGVNTYTDEEGRTVEFSTSADRVFQNNLDNNIHFGTEHYYGDYVPEGWSELFRRQ